MRYGWIAVLLLTVACGASPTPAPSPLPIDPPLPLAVTGQSQVPIFAPTLAQMYPGRVVGAWNGGQSISRWDDGDRLWLQLAETLHEPLRAFVIAQGESDCDGLASAVPDYDRRFPELMARVRWEAQQPNLPILVVTVSPLPSCERVRAIQAAWVASDPAARLVSSDDAPRLNMPFDLHLTPEGGALVARRILEALP